MGKINQIETVTPRPTLEIRSFRKQSRFASAALQLALGVAFCTTAWSQSAASFGATTEAPDSQGARTSTVTAKEKTPATTVAITSSRFVGPTDHAVYLQSASGILTAKSRKTDPFGQYQDPSAKPVIKAPTRKRTRRLQQQKATPFSDIIRLIAVTTIMPKSKSFLIGTRSIKQGQTLPVVFRGKTHRVQVTSVTSRQIHFRNLDTGDAASLKLDMLPIGMTPGNQGISAPGMVPDRTNAPLELDSSNLSNSNSSLSNR